MADLTHARCTVQRRDGDFCDAPSIEEGPFPICGSHAAQLFRFTVPTMSNLTSQQPLFMAIAEADRYKREQAKEERHLASTKPVVYYIQVGEFIKIGTTIQLRERIKAYPPNKRLLATEPGGHSLESRRHEQFMRLLVLGREWFRPDA